MNTRKLLTVLKGIGIQNTPFLATAVTPTASKTVFFDSLGVISGKTITIDWGDGTVGSFSTTAARSHVYATAGTYPIKISPRGAINAIISTDWECMRIAVSATNPFPEKLVTLRMQIVYFTANLNTTPLPSTTTDLRLETNNNLTWNVNTTPMPSGVTNLYLSNLSNLTWNVNTTPIPSGVTTLTLNNVPGLTWNGTLPNGIRTAIVTNYASQATVDSWLYAVLSNKASFTYTTPLLNLGGTNAAPSGTYQAADPVTSGKEAKYALVNGNGSYAPGPEWTVTTN